MSFKEALAHDAEHVFMNPREFADLMTINGLPVPALWDDALQPKGQGSQTDPTGWGVVSHTAALLVLAKDFPVPLPGEEIVVEGVSWIVAKTDPQQGILRLDLERNTA